MAVAPARAKEALVAPRRAELVGGAEEPAELVALPAGERAALGTEALLQVAAVPPLVRGGSLGVVALWASVERVVLPARVALPGPAAAE